ncbi:conserved hypothetical protein [Vulcanisaeta distributa DSM 14429]|uniref:DUF1634 domain-containing protein n=2 Tax=Vulcanisaeta distributa TaxID=164451 RepID=E1QPF3_VULDI|nr:conserved hypothetical protein [Vulcanisaeta distributa DSM 14429]
MLMYKIHRSTEAPPEAKSYGITAYWLAIIGIIALTGVFIALTLTNTNAVTCQLNKLVSGAKVAAMKTCYIGAPKTLIVAERTAIAIVGFAVIAGLIPATIWLFRRRLLLQSIISLIILILLVLAMLGMVSIPAA